MSKVSLLDNDGDVNNGVVALNVVDLVATGNDDMDADVDVATLDDDIRVASADDEARMDIDVGVARANDDDAKSDTDLSKAMNVGVDIGINVGAVPIDNIRVLAAICGDGEAELLYLRLTSRRASSSV